MTPEELQLILDDSNAIDADPDAFSATFYETVFDLAPAARDLFPENMDEQRRKLVRELRFLISAATSWSNPDQLESFVVRGHELGRRHVDYQVTADMYQPVGAALVATLRDSIDGFDDRHEAAWSKLLTLVTETMLEGAAAGAQ